MASAGRAWCRFRQRCSKRWPARARRQSGFSLLEALVAMSIASIALASLYRTVGQSSKVAMDVESRIEAALVARSALAGSTFAEDAQSQPQGVAGDWQWRLVLQPEEIALSAGDGRAVAGKPLRAARVTVEVARVVDGSVVLTWSTWKPYRAGS
ncbi:prepilin-type N-terminal cleavage/methylation domain-containing protein [Acidovorax sp.]|uniref:type IV pilus modification PilV family protein n=1 Tax=Acidovorax sp. TaxID=1872122 RepID=UPI00391F5110